MAVVYTIQPGYTQSQAKAGETKMWYGEQWLKKMKQSDLGVIKEVINV